LDDVPVWVTDRDEELESFDGDVVSLSVSDAEEDIVTSDDPVFDSELLSDSVFVCAASTLALTMRRTTAADVIVHHTQ
jgi:hypothetical protein